MTVFSTKSSELIPNVVGIGTYPIVNVTWNDGILQSTVNETYVPDSGTINRLDGMTLSLASNSPPWEIEVTQPNFDFPGVIVINKEGWFLSQRKNWINNNKFDMDILEESMDDLIYYLQNVEGMILARSRIVKTQPEWGTYVYFFDVLHPGGTVLPVNDVYGRAITQDIEDGVNGDYVDMYLNGILLIENRGGVIPDSDFDVDYTLNTITPINDIPALSTVVVEIQERGGF